jgi:uncharacterized protein (TIGR03118 family)
LLFSTEDGTIAGWNPKVSQTRAVIAADQSGNGAVYKGLAMGSNAQGTFLYATNFHNGTIDVFDTNFHLAHFGSGAFVDPTTGTDAIPSDFAPFGIANFNGTLVVTYAKQNAEKHDDVAGVGNGFIDEFGTSGDFIRRFATRGLLNSPWGMAMAPANFGRFSNDVLIGNFGDSHVNAFDPVTGAFLGQLTDTHGNPLALNGGFKETDTKGLWGIGFGNGAGGAATNTLFFASGINQENDGLFGTVTADGGASVASVAARHVHGARPSHHRPFRAEAGPARHSAIADPAATKTSTSFHTVAQFNNASFSGTVAIADNDIWAVGDSTASGTAQALAVHFNGTSWSVVPTSTLAASSSELAGVAAVASNNVWAVGSQTVSGTSNTLIEHWDGTSWSVVTSPTPSGGGSLTAVTAISSTDVWAVGIQSQISGDVVEHWDGTRWTLVSSPAFTGASDILRGISADASNDVWAVGDSFSVGGAVILHFDGTSWSRVAAPPVDRSLLAVTVLSPTNAWAAGGAKGPPPSDTEAAVAQWNGTSWSAVSSPNPMPNGTSLLLGIAAASAKNIDAVGSAIEHWNGHKWSIVTTPSGVFGMDGVTALSDGTVVIVSSGGAILEN